MRSVGLQPHALADRALGEDVGAGADRPGRDGPDRRRTDHRDELQQVDDLARRCRVLQGDTDRYGIDRRPVLDDPHGRIDVLACARIGRLAQRGRDGFGVEGRAAVELDVSAERQRDRVVVRRDRPGLGEVVDRAALGRVLDQAVVEVLDGGKVHGQERHRIEVVDIGEHADADSSRAELLGEGLDRDRDGKDGRHQSGGEAGKEGHAATHRCVASSVG